MSALLPWWWRWALLAVLCAAFFVGGAVFATDHQKARAEAIQRQFDAFKAQTDAASRQAAAEAQAHAVVNQQLKESSDAENQRTTADLRARVERLRHANDATGPVPAAPPGAVRPDLQCFDRPELERALGDFLEEARAIADAGSQAAVDLNTAREWVAGLKRAESMTVR